MENPTAPKLDKQIDAMPTFPRLEGRRLAVFLGLFAATFGGMLAAILSITLQSADPYPDGVDFAAMGGNDLVIVNRLSEPYITGLKMDFGASRTPPRVGVFGSHAINGFSAAAAGAGPDGFFNYSVTHLGLPDIRAQIAYLGAQGKLPRQLLFVALQNPHTDNFDHISQHINELPPEMYLLHGSDRVTNNLRRTLRLLGRTVRDRLDWRTVIYDLARICEPRYGVFDRQQVSKHRVALGDDLGAVGQLALRIFTATQDTSKCPAPFGLLRDGRDMRWHRTSDAMKPAAGPVKVKSIPGGVGAVLDLMTDIQRIGGAAAEQVVFFIPPVLEEPRTSPQSTSMDVVVERAGALGMRVVDHRHGYGAPRFFFDYMHPNEAYFQALVAGIRNPQ